MKNCEGRTPKDKNTEGRRRKNDSMNPDDEKHENGWNEFVNNIILGGDGKNSLDGDVKTRYGKWQAILANQTELSMYLHQEGAQGLEQFGYEPRKEISYMKNQTSVCDESVECPRSKTSNRNNVPISSVELGRSNLIDQQMYQIRKLERSSKVIEV